MRKRIKAVSRRRLLNRPMMSQAEKTCPGPIPAQKPALGDPGPQEGPPFVPEAIPGWSFEDWLLEWADEIVQAQAHTKKDLPTSQEEIQPDLTITTRDYPRMAELLADVEGFLLKRRAQETLSVRYDPKFSDLSAAERKSIIESRLADIIHARDILRTTCRALEERSYVLMNQRKFCEAELRMTPHRED